MADDDIDIDQEIEAIEAGMSDDFAGYQADTAKQARYGNLLAAQEAGTEAPPKPSAAAERLGEIELMMADRHSPYWKAGATGDGLQAEYRRLLNGERAGTDGRPNAPVALTPSESRAAIEAIAASGTVGEAWAAELGTGANAAKALQVGEDQARVLLDGMGDSAGDVEQSFSGLEQNIQYAVARELATTGAPPQPEASREEMEKFKSTDHGAILIDDWGGEAARNVGRALFRWQRMTVLLDDAEDAALHDYFWHMTAKERASIVQHLGA